MSLAESKEIEIMTPTNKCPEEWKDGRTVILAAEGFDFGIGTANYDKEWGLDGWWMCDDGKCAVELPLRGAGPTHICLPPILPKNKIPDKPLSMLEDIYSYYHSNLGWFTIVFNEKYLLCNDNKVIAKYDLLENAKSALDLLIMIDSHDRRKNALT